MLKLDHKNIDLLTKIYEALSNVLTAKNEKVPCTAVGVGARKNLVSVDEKVKKHQIGT